MMKFEGTKQKIETNTHIIGQAHTNTQAYK